MPNAAEPSRNETPDPGTAAPAVAAGRPLTPAARRALDEAAARRASTEGAPASVEQGGPPGPEPTRYGDWERKGLAVDF